MKKIELEIVALSHSTSSSPNYAVVLGEQSGARRLPIVIGGPEAQALAVAMERLNPTRPMTHDLLKNIFNTFEIELKEVIISNLLDGIFYARLICIKDGKIEEIDSRTSDALALAVRFECPIYTYEFILDAAGVVLEEGDSSSKPRQKEEVKKKETRTTSAGGYKHYSIEELNQKLDEVLADEDYEKAAKIRDEIKKREEA